MLTVCHLFDQTACWEHRAAVGQLLDRLPAERFQQILAVTDHAALPELRRLGREIAAFPVGVGAGALLNLRVLRFIKNNQIDLVHAWGPDAAGAARAAEKPLVLSLSDPRVACERAKLIRAIARPDGFRVVCSAEWVRRRLVENGVAADSCVVVRPGVDFAALNAARRQPVRAELGIGDEAFVVLVPEPPTRSVGQRDAFWASALANHLDGNLRFILPGESVEADRIERFAGGLPTENALIRTFRRYPFEALVPHADALVVAAEGDTSITPIAWAMGAKTTVIASAVHAVTELVAHKVGGLLFKRSAGRFNPVRLVKLLRDRDPHVKVREAAHGMAYESFGVRRFIDEHVQVYESVLGLASSDEHQHTSDRFGPAAASAGPG